MILNQPNYLLKLVKHSSVHKRVVQSGATILSPPPSQKSDKMSSFVKSNRKCLCHYEYIIEMLFNRVFNIICMAAKQMCDAYSIINMYLLYNVHVWYLLEHEKRIISRYLIVILLSFGCLLARCKSIFIYLPLM